MAPGAGTILMPHPAAIVVLPLSGKAKSVVHFP